MKKILFIFLIIVSCSVEKQEQEVNIGLKSPNYVFKDVLNSDKKTISIHDLKGKVIILEFWATWCGPCLPMMKKLDSLKTEFKDDIEVIAISTESKKRLLKYIDNSNTNLKIVSDTTHLSTFKYEIIPHSIIIDKKGIVQAITNPKNIDKEVIKNLISQNKIDLELKNDSYYDPKLKVTTVKSISNSDYRIELKNYDQEKSGGFRVTKNINGDINGIEIYNSTIPRLYQSLFDIISPSRISFEDSLTRNDFPYKKEHLYNLTIEVSPKFEKQWRQVGVNFLNENLDFNARIGIDTLSCYVLKKTENILEKSDSKNTELSFMGSNFNAKKIKIKKLIEYLENLSSVPIVDQTNLKDEYDIELNWESESPETLISELKKYGLVYEKSKKKLPVEVVKIFRKD